MAFSYSCSLNFKNFRYYQEYFPTCSGLLVPRTSTEDDELSLKTVLLDHLSMFSNSGLVFSSYFSIPEFLNLGPINIFFGLDGYFLWGTFLFTVICFSSIPNLYLLDANSNDDKICLQTLTTHARGGEGATQSSSVETHRSTLFIAN